MFSYDTKGVKPSEGYQVAPDGIYELVIANASDEKDGIERRTKNGDPYVNLECQIVGNEEWDGKKIFHNVTFLAPDRKGAGMALAFLKAIGEPYEGEIAIDPDHWIGKRFKAKVIISKDNKGRPRNEIAYLVNEGDMDEVPF